jgi:hypothetical protein
LIIGANGCRSEISNNDSNQAKAIQCHHQNEQFEWIDSNENCSGCLCNGCKIKLNVNIDDLWFCNDYEDMHIDKDAN